MKSHFLLASVIGALTLGSVDAGLNDVYWFGLPTLKNGGAFFAGAKETVIMCWERKADDYISDFEFKLDSNWAFSKSVTGLQMNELTKDSYEKIKYEAGNKWGAYAPKEYQKYSELSGSSSSPEKNPIVSREPSDSAEMRYELDSQDEQVRNELEGFGFGSGPIFGSRSGWKIDDNGDKSVQLRKRGIFNGNKDGGSIFDVPPNWVGARGKNDRPLCYYATFKIRDDMSPKISYKIEAKRWRRLFLGKKEWESPKFVILRPPTSNGPMKKWYQKLLKWN